MNPYLQTPLIDWRMDEDGNVNPYIPNQYGRQTGMVAGQPPKFKPQPNAMGQLPTPAPAQAPTPQPEKSIGLLGNLKKSAEGIDGNQIMMALGSGMLGLSNDPRLQQLGMAGFEQVAKSRDSKKAKELTNKTIAKLREMKRFDLADAVEGGLMSATDAAKEIFRRVEGKEFQGNWIDPYTGKVITEGKGNGYLDPKEQLSAINVLRDDLRNDLGVFNDTQDAWNKISYLYEQKGGTSDYALTIAFAKILDPASVVRGEEQDAIANSGALAPAIKSQLISMLDSKTGSLPQYVKDQILNIAKNQYSTQLEDARGKFNHYQSLAKDYGLDPKYLYSGAMDDPNVSVTELTPDIIASVKANDPTATDAEIAEWWDSLTPKQRREQKAKGG